MNRATDTLTFLFTDIEGSTRLWEQNPETMRTALAQHDALLRNAIETNQGTVFKTMGDSFFAAFATPAQAVTAALDSQAVLLAQQWSTETPLRVRMALHAGVVEERNGDYFGQPLNLAARLLAVGHGGQVLVSHSVCTLLSEEVELADLGTHMLRDLQQPEHVFQLLHPNLPADFPPLRSLQAFANNLPQQVTSFIGRERELAEIKRLLNVTRLLTLTGAGGIGKTRLLLQTAAEAIEDYSDGIWLVELAPLSDVALIPQAVATALGIRPEPGQTLTQSIVDYLKNRTTLILLDNCEHLVDACAHLVEAIIRSCPSVAILASSRAPLGIVGEQIYRVPSLGVPNTAQSQETQDLSQFEAVRLFVERAVGVAPSFALTDHNASALTQVCQRLDGIPLALELAAVRVRAMPVEQIASRLDDRFRLLTGGSRTALPRQQTLRALIDWSYDLLDGQERTLLARLSVFAGGWTIEAAEAVCADTEIESWQILDLLISLVDKSLVIYEEKQSRYRMLETVRQYARDRLQERNEHSLIRNRHRTYFLGIVETAKGFLDGQEQVRWLSLLEAEYDNFRSVLDFCRSTDEAANPQIGLQVAEGLWWFWRVRGYWREGLETLMALLAQSQTNQPSLLRAKALYAAGCLTCLLNEYTEARLLLQESLALAQRQNAKQDIANALHALGNLALDQGEVTGAIALLEESLELRREIGDRTGIATSLLMLGNVALTSDLNVARERYEESLRIRREYGDKKGIASALNNLGEVARDQGNYDVARGFYEESLTISQELGDRWGVSTALGNLGMVAMEQSHYADARSLYNQSLTLAQEVGNRRGVASTFANLGHLAHIQGDYAAAGAYYAQSQALYEELGDRWGMATTLRHQGNLEADQGNYAAAHPLHEEYLTISRELADTHGIAMALYNLGDIAWSQGNDEAARSYWEECLILDQQLGIKGGSVLGALGALAAHQGNYAEAYKMWKRSLREHQEIGDRKGVAESLEGLARGEIVAHRPERSAHLIAAASALRESLGVPVPHDDQADYQRTVAQLRVALGEEKFVAIWATGRSWTMEQALLYALEDTDQDAL